MGDIDFNQALGELQEKARKYDYMKENFVNMEANLNDALALLQSLKLKFNPLANVSKRGRSKGVKNKVLLEEVFKVMEGGTHVGRDFLEKAYPDINPSYLLKKISEFPKVDSRRDGKKVIYFLRHV